METYSQSDLNKGFAMNIYTHVSVLSVLLSDLQTMVTIRNTPALRSTFGEFTAKAEYRGVDAVIHTAQQLRDIVPNVSPVKPLKTESRWDKATNSEVLYFKGN